MIGRPYWIAIWYGILLLGLLGFGAAIFWGRRTAWRNLDEVYRAIGTILVSIGMLLLLHRVAGWYGQAFLGTALVSFVLAFVHGRRRTGPPPPGGA